MQMKLIMNGEHIFNSFLWVVHDSVLETKCTLFTDEAWFHLCGYINAKKKKY
jgi:hypothetical protein